MQQYRLASKRAAQKNRFRRFVAICPASRTPFGHLTSALPSLLAFASVSRHHAYLAAVPPTERRPQMSTNPYDEHLEKNPANYQPLTPLQFLQRAALIFPNHTAIIHGQQRFTYAQFYARCRRLASALTARGIGPGDTVSVMLANTPPMLEAHYAVPMAGAVLHTIKHAPRRADRRRSSSITPIPSCSSPTASSRRCRRPRAGDRSSQAGDHRLRRPRISAERRTAVGRRL